MENSEVPLIREFNLARYPDTFDIDNQLYKEELPNVLQIVKSSAKRTCSTDTLVKRFPVIKWLPRYKPKFLLDDFVAGLTVGLTAIPQGIAYGVIAGLPAQYGLYSAFMGCFMYIIFGTCKDITVGPTAIMALMVQKHGSLSYEFVVLSCFLAGCVIFLMGILNLGVLVQFISAPVSLGFTTAAAITIGSGQINSLFGIKSSSNEFLASWENFFTHIKSASLNDSLLGILTLVFLLALRKTKDLPFPSMKKLFKYISLSRNAVAVFIGALLAYLLTKDGITPFRLTGEVRKGLPEFRPPPFSANVNGTIYNFSDMINELGSSIFTVPLISLLESIAIAKAFSKGKAVDASQEMIALGMCNIMGSFVQSMPTTGSFTRTAVNNASGVKTPLGGAFTGMLVLLALAFLTTTFSYIPKATLAAIIIAAMIFMVEYEKILEIWRAKKIDIVPFLVTGIACLFMGLEYGMIIGILLNLTFIMYSSSRPPMTIIQEKVHGMEVAVVDIHADLRYSSAEYIKEKIIKFVLTNNESHESRIALTIVLGENINTIDSTVAMNLISMIDDLALLQSDIMYWNWNVAAVGVMCRLNKDVKTLLKYGKTIEDVVIQYLRDQKKDNYAP